MGEEFFIRKSLRDNVGFLPSFFPMICCDAGGLDDIEWDHLKRSIRRLSLGLRPFLGCLETLREINDGAVYRIRECLLSY